MLVDGYGEDDERHIVLVVSVARSEPILADDEDRWIVGALFPTGRVAYVSFEDHAMAHVLEGRKAGVWQMAFNDPGRHDVAVSWQKCFVSLPGEKSS